MAKKGFGKLVAFAAVTGAVAASVSYALRYKTFHSELEKDFREFEDGEDEACEDSEERTVDPRRTDRNYISLHASKDEFKLAAKDMAEATKNVLKDAGAVISDTAHEAVSAAVDTAHIALTAVKNKRAEFEDAMDEDEEEDSELLRTKASWTTIMWTTTICSTTPARRAMEFPPGRNRFPRRRPLPQPRQ